MEKEKRRDTSKCPSKFSCQGWRGKVPDQLRGGLAEETAIEEVRHYEFDLACRLISELSKAKIDPSYTFRARVPSRTDLDAVNKGLTSLDVNPDDPIVRPTVRDHFTAVGTR